ncbi:unnamed protein product [Rotaria sp. Silwood2]|nr:unnamed protein product [Rotaria sp. Silwood2]
MIERTTYAKVSPTDDANARILTHIFTTFSNLQYFNFCPSSIWNQRLGFANPYPEDIQHTFRDFKDDQVISYIDYFQERQSSLCHIYLYPEQLKYYYTVTNKLSGGLLTCVREISLYDERPFEHEFFLRIAQSFPFMKVQGCA